MVDWEDAGKGAIGGAGAGAAVGSVVPFIGTGVGAGVGAVAGGLVGGLFGGGPEKPDPLGREDLSNPEMEHGDGIREGIYREITGVRSRETPQSQAAQLGAAERATSGQVGTAAQANTALLGSANQVNAAQLGQASQAQSGQLGSAALGQRVNLGGAAQGAGVNIASAQQQQFRDAQAGLLGDLQAQAAGTAPSAASMEASRAANQNFRQQMALSRSGRGGNQGMLARQAARGITDFNTTALQEAAIGRARERDAAQQLIGNITSQARAQDIGLASSQAGMDQATQLANQQAANERAFQQGQIDHATFLANQQALNQFASQQASMDQATNLANMQAQNERAFQQGQIDQTAYLANQQAINQFAMTQAGFEQETGLFNAGQANQFSLAQAGFDQQTNLANQAAGNQFTLQQGQFDQETNLANVQAELQSRGLDDAAIRGYLQDLTGMDAIDLDASLTQDKMMVYQAVGYTPPPTLGDQLLGIGGSALTAVAGRPSGGQASDVRVKENISDGRGRIAELLNNSTGYEYDYKDPARDGWGRRVGPMAQDLEKSEIGREMVTDTPDGKRVTVNPMTGLAIDSFLWDEIQKVKKGDR